MKKLAVFGLVASGVIAMILVARRSRSSLSPEEREAKRGQKRQKMFEKMRAGMESMPEDFPPRVMFDNVAVTRENTERILDLLEQDRSDTEEPSQ